MRYLLLAIAASLIPASAFAHAFLDHAMPPVGSTVTAPRQVRIFFTEALEPAFSGATIAAANGNPVATGAAAPDPADPKQLVLPVPPLAPGTYAVTWHVVSVDTHRTEGHFTFSVKP